MPETDLDAFEAEARAFLDANAARRTVTASDFVRWGEGSGEIHLFESRTRADDLEELTAASAWRARQYDAGFGWITGPKAYGGRELPAAFERRWRELESVYATPNQDIFGVGLGMVGPTIAAYGTEEAKAGFLRGLYRGEMVGCQLFSEPAAGSDLASLEARAERDGDEWVVNGQKVWTSHANVADIGLLLARTDPRLPKHKGLTAFVVDMAAAGVDVRPLRQMNGNANFSEVFLTDVRIPDRDRLGGVNEGWRTAMTTLGNERASIGAGRNLTFLLSRLIAMVQHYELTEEPNIRQELMKVVIGFRVAEMSNRRAMARVVLGQAPGSELAMAKQAGIQNLRVLVDLAAKVLGPRITADTGEWGTWPWARILLAVPGQRIGGGTDEVMRNVVAERVLGLPKDPGIDPNVPFDELKRGAPRAP